MAKQLKSIKFPGLDEIYEISGGTGTIDIDLDGAAEGGVKPQSPLKHTESGDYFYPITTEDQIIMDDGSRLNSTINEINNNINEINNDIVENRNNINSIASKTAILATTTSDNGKFLRVVNGIPSWQIVTNAEEVSV